MKFITESDNADNILILKEEDINLANDYLSTLAESFGLSEDEIQIPPSTLIKRLDAVFPKVLSGFICCDEIIYEPQTKTNRITTAYFLIELICPNPVREEADQQVENLAVRVRATLENNPTLDGWAEYSNINRLQFRTPAGSAAIGAAIMEFEVKFIE